MLYLICFLLYYSYYRGATAAVLVYDITNYRTFQNTSIWIEDIRKAAASRIVILLVGNKCDLESLREVTVEEATYFASKKIDECSFKILFFKLNISN